MNLKHTPVVPTLVQAFCECGGELRATGASRSSAPPLNAHRCQACGQVEWIRGEIYPTIEYQQLEFEFPESEES